MPSHENGHASRKPPAGRSIAAAVLTEGVPSSMRRRGSLTLATCAAFVDPQTEFKPQRSHRRRRREDCAGDPIAVLLPHKTPAEPVHYTISATMMRPQSIEALTSQGIAATRGNWAHTLRPVSYGRLER